MKKLGLGVIAFLSGPVSVYVIWLTINALHSLFSPLSELVLTIATGFLLPILLLTFIFKITSSSSPPMKKIIRIPATVGCVLTVILVLVAIPWIKFGIAYRGVRM